MQNKIVYVEGEEPAARKRKFNRVNSAAFAATQTTRNMNIYRRTGSKGVPRIPLKDLLNEWAKHAGQSPYRFAIGACIDGGNMSRAMNGKVELKLTSILKIMRAWDIPIQELDRLLIEDSNEPIQSPN